MLSATGVRDLLEAFDLGDGVLSPAPVARGRLGEVWRLDATSGTWAVKTDRNAVSELGVQDSARFQEAAVAAGVRAPALRRTPGGRVYATAAGVRVLEWVDMAEADRSLDPVAVGRLVAGLHRVEMPGTWSAADVDPWFCAPVGAAAWDTLIRELGRRRAPFADRFAAHRDELVALERLLEPPARLRWCHRDLFEDNLRGTGDGVVVFDFDNSGPENADRELAMVVTVFAVSGSGVDSTRVRALLDAYADAGGPGRLTRPEDFGLVVAELGHIAEHAAQRWLAAAADEADGAEAERQDMAAWAAEITDRPLTREVVEQILDAAG